MHYPCSSGGQKDQVSGAIKWDGSWLGLIVQFCYVLMEEYTWLELGRAGRDSQEDKVDDLK